MGIVLWVTLVLGFTNIFKSIAKAIGYDISSTDVSLMLPVIGISFLISFYLLWKIYKKRIKLVEQRI